MGNLFRDLRLSLRSLRSSPGVTVLAMVALALGIGANSAIFSVVRSVLLRPLPYAEPQRLVVALLDGRSPVSPADYFEWREHIGAFGGNVAAAQAWSASVGSADGPEVVRGIRVTASMFPLLGVAPMLGRPFAEGESRAVVLTHGLWQRNYAADAAVVGKTVVVDGENMTIVGVMPPSFHFAPFWATHAEVISPLDLSTSRNDRGGRSLRVFARLAAGASLASAQSEMDAYDQRMAEAFAESHSGVHHRVVDLHEQTVGGIRSTLLALMGTVGFVLLLACVNVAHLLLVKASARRKEIAVHLALGATPAGLLRRCLVESLLLSAAGSALGVALASVAVRALLRMLPLSALPRQQEVALDGWVLACGVLAGLAAGGIGGIFPAWQALRIQLAPSLRASSRGSTGDQEQRRARQLLIAAEVALATVLMVGAGLMIRTMSELGSVRAGFEPQDVVTMTISVNGPRYPDSAARIAFFDRLLYQLSSCPGCDAVALTNHLPIQGDQWQMRYQVGGEPVPERGHEPRAIYRVATPGYFRTMGIPILDGRDFTAGDRENAPGVVIVNNALAKRHWGNRRPVGERLRLGRTGEWLTVAGVVGDVRQTSWMEPGAPEFYLPYAQSDARAFRFMTLVGRTPHAALPLGQIVRAQIQSLDREVPVSAPLEMEQAIADQLWRNRLSLWIFGAFSGLALLIAALGIYGVASHAVGLRVREFGIRLALGAGRGSLLSMVARQELFVVLLGGMAGLAAAVGLARFMQSLLFGISPIDFRAFGAALIALLVVAVLAVIMPARRLLRVDPASALRQE